MPNWWVPCVGGSRPALEVMTIDPTPLALRKPRLGALACRKTRRLLLAGLRAPDMPRSLYQHPWAKGSSLRWPLFAADAQLPRVPVNVIEFERYHFTGAQAQSLRAGAKCHSRDTLSRCADRCCPATGGPGQRQSLVVSRTSTS
jgi:hypothetical protein